MGAKKPKVPYKDLPDYNAFKITRTSNLVAMLAERGMLKHELAEKEAKLKSLNEDIELLMVRVKQDRLRVPGLVLGRMNGRSAGKYDKMKAVEEGHDVETVEAVFKDAYVKGEPYTYIQVWPQEDYDKGGEDE